MCTGCEMKHEPDNSFHARTLERPTCTEYYVTDADDDPSAAFSRAAELIADNGFQTIQEKVYGRKHARDEILTTRATELRERGLDDSLPLTFVEGEPAASSTATLVVGVESLTRQSTANVQVTDEWERYSLDWDAFGRAGAAGSAAGGAGPDSG